MIAMNDKAERLTKLAREMSADASLPLCESNFVFGEGRADAEVMFIGEAPGFNEDRLKRPFVGRGGQLLDKLIGEVGWKRGNVYITNILKRRPPENRDPLPEEVAAYGLYLAKQIEIVDPKLIVALGRFAMNYFLPDAKISRDQGKIFRVGGLAAPELAAASGGGRLVVPLYHPAAALRSPQMMEDLRKNFRRLPEILRGDFAVVMSVDVLGGKKKERGKRPRQAGLF